MNTHSEEKWRKKWEEWSLLFATTERCFFLFSFFCFFLSSSLIFFLFLFFHELYKRFGPSSRYEQEGFPAWVWSNLPMWCCMEHLGQYNSIGSIGTADEEEEEVVEDEEEEEEEEKKARPSVIPYISCEEPKHTTGIGARQVLLILQKLQETL